MSGPCVTVTSWGWPGLLGPAVETGIVTSVLLDSGTSSAVQIADRTMHEVVGGRTTVIGPAGFSLESRSGMTMMTHSASPGRRAIGLDDGTADYRKGMVAKRGIAEAGLRGEPHIEPKLRTVMGRRHIAEHGGQLLTVATLSR